MDRIANQVFDEERSLYNLRDTEVVECTFSGPADGESVLKECRGVKVENCTFSLRYPLWHAKEFVLNNSSMDDKTREWFSYYNGQKIILPDKFMPGKQFIEYHNDVIFKGA